MANVVISNNNQLASQTVKPFFYISVDGSREKFPDEAKNNPAFTGNTSEELINFMENNISGFSTSKFNIAVIYTNADNVKQRIDSFSKQAPFPISNNPLVISTSTKKQSGAVNKVVTEKVDPNSLSYNELRNFIKMHKVPNTLGSSPSKKDLIATIEAYYKNQVPLITEKVKAEKVAVKKAVAKKEELPTTEIVTEENVSKPVTQIVTEAVIKNFTELMEEVKAFLKQSTETKIAYYKQVAAHLLTQPVTEEDLKAVDSLFDTLNNDFTTTRDITRSLDDISDIIEVVAEEVPSEQPTTINEILSDVEEESFINSMLN